MLQKSLIRILVLLVLLSGAPVDTASLYAQERTTRPTTKKPVSSKKQKQLLIGIIHENSPGKNIQRTMAIVIVSFFVPFLITP